MKFWIDSDADVYYVVVAFFFFFFLIPQFVPGKQRNLEYEKSK